MCVELPFECYFALFDGMFLTSIGSSVSSTVVEAMRSLSSRVETAWREGASTKRLRRISTGPEARLPRRPTQRAER